MIIDADSRNALNIYLEAAVMKRFYFLFRG